MAPGGFRREVLMRFEWGPDGACFILAMRGREMREREVLTKSEWCSDEAWFILAIRGPQDV